LAEHPTTNELVKILKEWQNLETQTINLSNELMEKSGNAFIRVTTEMIRKDSEKHKAMLQFTLDHLTKESVRLTPQDLIPLSEILDKHLKAEAKSMGMANSAITKNKDVLTGYILSYLLADEVRHHEMLSRLDHMKAAVYQ
jgi:chaperonin cofactor prefoldin